MAKINKDELRKIAQLSHITLSDEELTHLVADIDGVLTYAVRVCEIAADIDEPSPTNVNVMRDDVVVPTDPQPILDQAPERMHDYFVVPMILDSDDSRKQ